MNNDEDFFEKDNDNIEEDDSNIEENNDNDEDKKERSLESGTQEEQYKEEEGEKQYIIQQIQDYLKDFENILNQIDEGIDKLDSYERTMQIKRSIDRLIETLYSQAASEDINTELETTKNTSDKSASVKRIREKRRKRLVEEILSSMFAQEQKGLINAKHLGHRHETAKDGDVHEAKEKVKSSIRGVLFSVIGNAMNPRRMAGETDDSNKKGAERYGREAAGGVLGALLKTFLTAVTAIVKEIFKPLQQHASEKETFVQKVEAGRNADKGLSM
ncbi:hypothetical protein [Wolbachia endosymbiont (group E) of Neria commutata]|uniref:hypothetical protein n=1 Tax=Wolbachia endosymbiont (group E) of Neria commutata TaxID=3066149 RepID=UPI0031334511